MFEYDICRIVKDKSFSITGVSYIGKPVSGTAMYLSKKIEDKIYNLSNCTRCLIFLETGINVPDEIAKNNALFFSDNPQLAYAKFACDFEKLKNEAGKKYRYNEKDGYCISETAVIGSNAYIEEGCLIGHDVVIGNNAIILKGSVIKNSIIGDNVLVNEYAVVGANGFTMATDENGNKMRIPSLGNVVIGNDVEIGAHDNISRGSAGSTVLDDYVKLDAFVHIGHDANLMKNVEVTAGAIVGGFDVIEENVFLGLNSTLRNRIVVKSDVTVGMGAVVTKSVEAQNVIVGNPAKRLVK